MNLLRILASTLPVALLIACGPSDRSIEIREAREVSRGAPKLDASSAERFGTMRGAASGGATAKQGGAEPFLYQLPAGWQKLGPAQFRDVNLEAPGGVKCWITVMPPSSTALAHLERWAGQLGLPSPDQAAVDALPKVALLGGEARRVDLRSADGRRRLIVTMLLAPMQHVFVRMEGAPEAVEAQVPALASFEASLRIAPGGGSDETDPPAEAAEPSFAWTAPADWKAIGPGTMKLEQFEIEGGIKCWLTLLVGDGGGVEPNLTRWCGVVGVPMLSAAQIEALERLEILGRPSLYVPLFAEGDEPGLVGVMIPLPSHSLYVRMSGPSRALRGKVEQFKSFCHSLRLR